MNNKTKPKPIFIYGKHPVMEALVHNPKILSKVFVSEKSNDEALQEALKKAGIKPAKLGSGNEIPPDEQNPKGHQGVIARISLNDLMVPYKEFASSLKVTPDTSLMLLGEIQDPHNVGAVIRSAAAFGVSGVLIPEHNQAQVTGSVVKVSAGMAFKIPLVAIGNVNHTISDLKKKGFWVYGLDGAGEQSLSDEKFEEPSVIVVGNEGTGIREKTKDACDTLINISMHPKAESLNAASSVSVTLYRWSTQHPDALEG